MNQFQSFDEIRAALKRRALLILVLTLVGCALSVNFALRQDKLYEATAVVQIEDARVPEELAGASSETEATARRVRLIEQRLMARDTLIRIMEKHDLFSDDPEMTTNERIFHMRQAASIEEIVNQTEAFAPGGRTPSGLMITVRLGDAQKAADVANELLHSVIDQARDRSVGRARDTLDFFVQEEARVRAEIEALEARIAAFKRDNAGQLPAGVADLRDQLVSLQEAELDLDRQVVTLETSSERLRDEVRQERVALLKEQKALISERIAQIRAQIAAAPEVERRLNRLERDLTQLQEQFAVVTRRKAEAEMGRMLEDRQQMDRFEVLETALVPEVPVSRSRKKIAAAGGVASLIVAVGVAWLLEALNPAIRSAAQMERILGVQPVVAIPVVETRRDRTRRGLAILGWVTGSLATLAALIAAFGNRIAWSDLLNRFVPRLANRTMQGQ